MMNPKFRVTNIVARKQPFRRRSETHFERDCVAAWQQHRALKAVTPAQAGA
jgi:hypothetical protein